MGVPCEILVLVDEETRPEHLLRSAGGTGSRVRVLRWALVTGEDLSRRGLRAVVFEAGETADDRRRREAVLRRVPGGVARISLAPKGVRPARRPRAQADIHLAAPIDLRVLTELISWERRCRDLEESCRRTRRVAARASRQLRILGEITLASNAEFDPRRIMEIALEKVRKIYPLSTWAVLLVDEEKSCLTFESCGGAPEMSNLLGSRLGMGEGAAGRVLRSRSPLLVGRPLSGSVRSSFPDIPETLPWSQLLALPLLSRGKVIGVVMLIQRPEEGRFRPRDVKVLSLLVEPMAIAIENALLLRRSEELSITDDLTKLYNSRYLNSYLSREVQRSRRYGAQVSLIFLDLDGFKNVNDQHGHLAGSRALVEMGAVIRNMVREIDIVSRFGGDEFTIILPQTGPEGAHTIAERIRCRVQETVFLEAFGLKVRITASFGIACFPNHADSKDALIQKADQAMYRVKGRGKNGVELAD